MIYPKDILFLQNIEEETRKLAYEKWQYRMANEMFFISDEYGNLREINSLDDWKEAQQEILDTL